MEDILIINGLEYVKSTSPAFISGVVGPGIIVQEVSQLYSMVRDLTNQVNKLKSIYDEQFETIDDHRSRLIQKLDMLEGLINKMECVYDGNFRRIKEEMTMHLSCMKK